ncbi:hypothetical protein ABK040_005224 [Willaertia magna]
MLKPSRRVSIDIPALNNNNGRKIYHHSSNGNILYSPSPTQKDVTQQVLGLPLGSDNIHLQSGQILRLRLDKFIL